jgi:L-fuconolactonase
VPPLNRTFLLEDYNRATSSFQIEKMVFVQCECSPAEYMKEVLWVRELARRDSRIQGIVSWAPLEKGEAVLPELEALNRNPLVKGIRRIIQFEADPDFCLRGDFIEGVRLLPLFGFTFDICISHDQAPTAVRFVEQCPEVRFVVDHIAKPDIRGRRLEPWRSAMKRLAEFPNVH